MNEIPFDEWLNEVNKYKRNKKLSVDRLTDEQIKFFHVCRDEEDGLSGTVVGYDNMRDLFNERYGTDLCKESIRNLWFTIKRRKL